MDTEQKCEPPLRASISDSDLAALREGAEERRHRAWLWLKINKVGRWVGGLALAVLALADGVDRLIQFIGRHRG